MYYKKPKISPAKKIQSAIKMLHNPTPAEKVLYMHLAFNRVFFRKQCVIRGYIVDAYLPREKVVIEVDGNHHYRSSQLQWDKKRDSVLRKIGLRVIRIKNSYLLNNPSKVVRELIKQHKINSIINTIDCRVSLQLAV